MKRDKSNKEET